MKKFTYNLFVYEQYDHGLMEMKPIEVEAESEDKAAKLIRKFCGIKYPGCNFSVEEIEKPTPLSAKIVMKMFEDSLED